MIILLQVPYRYHHFKYTWGNICTVLDETATLNWAHPSVLILLFISICCVSIACSGILWVNRRCWGFFAHGSRRACFSAEGQVLPQVVGSVLCGTVKVH